MSIMEFNTGLFDFLDVGSYGAWSEYCKNSINELVPDVIEISRDIIENIFSDAGIDVTCKDFTFHSPSYYNYENDIVCFNVEYDPMQLQYAILTQIHDGFYTYIKDRFKSYDGFISSIPDDKSGFIESLLSSDPYKAVAAFLSWYNNGCYNNYQEDFNDRIMETDVYYDYVLELEE